MKTKIRIILGCIIILAGAVCVHAEDEMGNTEITFRSAATGVREQLEQSLAELDSLRKEIAGEKIPLSRTLSGLESDLVKVRLDYQQASRTLDSRTLDLSNLRSEIRSREEEATYVSNLLGEYIRNFESRLHIAEIQRYRDALEEAKLAPENSNLTDRQVYEAQLALVERSIGRLNEALAGTSFEGTAVDEGGQVKPGTFVLVGPAALFRSEDGRDVGTAEQRLGSLEPAVIGFSNDGDTRAASRMVSDKKGYFPLDPSLGNAHKIEATREGLIEHVQKGGPVMVPIFLLAASAFFVAMYKWVNLSRMGTPSDEQIDAVLHGVARRDKDAAEKQAHIIGGPIGTMLAAGLEHLKESRELIEEVMYEKILATRLRIEKLLPFIAISASSAPLLGLLGTVTGIINTFKLITVFGSGDVKTLSGGISEALITTKFGLIVAIPSLLLHAFLSRKARGIIDQMEKSAVAFINQVSKTPFKPADAA